MRDTNALAMINLNNAIEQLNTLCVSVSDTEASLINVWSGDAADIVINAMRRMATDINEIKADTEALCMLIGIEAAQTGMAEDGAMAQGY